MIFVGDSRTVRIELHLENSLALTPVFLRDIDFVSREGMGIEWLKNTRISTDSFSGGNLLFRLASHSGNL